MAKIVAVDEIPAQSRSTTKENALVREFLDSGEPRAQITLEKGDAKPQSAAQAIRNFLKKHSEVDVKMVTRTVGEGDERSVQIYLERTDGSSPSELD
jgi:hypothetical protein